MCPGILSSCANETGAWEELTLEFTEQPFASLREILLGLTQRRRDAKILKSFSANSNWLSAQSIQLCYLPAMPAPSQSIFLWIGFNVFIILLLVFDLIVVNRKAREVTIREALLWSAFWIALSLAFNVGVYFWRGQEAAMQFFTGYLIEKSLSVDNLFVFLLIFSYFEVKPKFQRKVLFWGIIGALFLRAALIVAGVALINQFHWITFIFGGFLVVTGIRMSTGGDAEVEPDKNPIVRFFRKYFPVSTEYHGDKFFFKNAGRWFATPLFIVVLVVETTDLVFALDSIPAIFGISSDPFIVYTSNVFAILGLRALYFALAGVMKLFHYLKYGLAIVLVFIGMKMIVEPFLHIQIGIALGVIGVILGFSVALSLVKPKEEKH